MRVFKLSILFFISALFIAGCNTSQNDQTSADFSQVETVQGGVGYDEDIQWANENFDLQAVGKLLQEAKTAEEFEYLLNDSENGVNNLDLNGDGYTDYISVREFNDRSDDERGFSLFSMFGPELIQEIATIIFDRNGFDNSGARVLLSGNEQIYGDNYYYESNWRDRSAPIVDWLFTERSDYYQSPYYYENYPDNYEPYTVVETPVYRSRIEQYYEETVFVQTTQPTVTEIKIKSPYKDRSLNNIYSKMAKPTREQVDFRRNNPATPEFVRERKERMKNVSVKPGKPFNDKPNKFEKPEKVKNDRPQMREKPNKPERVKLQPQNPVRVERQKQPKVERQKQPKVEKPNIKPQKQENRVKPNDKGKGNGGGNNGGGNNKGGGKGKGKG